MKKKIIFATGNEGKLEEIKMILEGSGLEVISMKEAGISVPIEENGTTFEENAVIKAKTSQREPTVLCWQTIPAWKLII